MPANPGTFAYLCGMVETEELPGPFVTEVYGMLGLSPAAIRSVLHRAIEAGHLEVRRVGRYAVYGMRGDYLRRFRSIVGSDRTPTWRGNFHQVLYDVPESRREERDALRASAFSDGWGCPRPGVLLGMSAPGAWAVGHPAGRLTVDLETARLLVARGWPVADAAATVRAAADELTPTADVPPTPAERIARSHDVYWRVMLALGRSPHVPDELLPDDYPRAELAALLAVNASPLMDASCADARAVLHRAIETVGGPRLRALAMVPPVTGS